MTALPPELVLGGNRAVWVWWTESDPRVVEVAKQAGELPAGLLIDHGDHTLLVPWVPVQGCRQFTLDSLLPLTVKEHITCGACGRAGWITGNAWLPARADEVSR